MTQAKQSFWWSQDPLERFWLETTDRDDIGANLKAPQFDRAGKPLWRYTLLREVTPGDTVYHWHKKTGAIVGYSTVVGAAESKPIVWAARGIHARKSGTKPEKSSLLSRICG